MAVVPSRPLPPGIPPDCRGARKLFENATKGLSCRDILHVNSTSCSAAYLDMLGGCILGAAKYFVPFYVVQVIWNGKKALSGEKEFYKQLAYYYVRSIIFGATMGSTFTLASCTAVRLSHGYSYWTSILVPGTVAGLSILLEHIYRRRIVMNTFFNMALQYLYIRAQMAGLVHRTPAKETAAFMVINALLLYLLHKARKRKTIFWFYIPEGGTTSAAPTRKLCPVPHLGTCQRSTLMATARYTGLALTLQALRVFMAKGIAIAKTPTTFFREFLTLKTLAGTTSIGGYVFLYKVVRCMLAKRFGSDRCEHSALAGLVSGAAYWLQPNKTILTSALIAMIRLLHDYMPQKLRFLGHWPVPELIFALCNGILFHARCMDMAHCPKFIIHMMDTATQNRAKTIYDTYMHQVGLYYMRR